uniref:Uncharacterized protein n=1 Tax=Cryptomonas curvata TaxID=233186 RepID=A0A7S0QVU3_9CRYP|mmetsp:Transcript_55572/g.116277  ORF Transcript_55572/g.116277 Transcript_55572/m.116277 type:complete len:107 (+) Transcript_55572:166-486(+)
MANKVRRAMLPNNHEVFQKSLAEALDGNQILDFYWTDAIDAMKRSVAKLQYNGKLYTTFKPGTSAMEPNARVFDKAGISGTLASICSPYQLIKATLMYMVQSITIR